MSKKVPAKSKKMRLILFAGVLAALMLLAVILGYSATRKARFPLQYADEVHHWADEYGVDPYLVFAVIHTESGFNPNAVSSANARGLMQMTEETFEWIKGKIAPQEPLVFDDLYQPDVSIRFGVYFISLCLARYDGDVATAAAAYHSGWTTVDRLLEQAEYSQDGKTLLEFPYPQMANYVHKINQRHETYLQLYA